MIHSTYNWWYHGTISTTTCSGFLGNEEGVMRNKEGPERLDFPLSLPVLPEAEESPLLEREEGLGIEK